MISAFDSEVLDFSFSSINCTIVTNKHAFHYYCLCGSCLSIYFWKTILGLFISYFYFLPSLITNTTSTLYATKFQYTDFDRRRRRARAWHCNHDD